MEYARAQGCAWDAWTFAFAAEGGHLDVLILAAEHGCPMNADTPRLEGTVCRYAALGGHLETLKWAREHNFDWDVDTCAWAAGKGQLEEGTSGCCSPLHRHAR